MIIFGGTPECAPNYSDVWVLENANGNGGQPTWTQLAPTNAIAGRYAHSAVYDQANNRMIVFGGTPNNQLTNEVLVLTNADGTGGTPSWIVLTPSGSPPPPRFFHSAVYDPSTNSMLIFGGQADSTVLNDVWMLSNANGLGGQPAWTQLSPAGPLPLPRGQIQNAVYHVATKRMIMFGGTECSGPGITGCFNGVDTWVLAVDTAAPEIRCGTPDTLWHAFDVSIACTAQDAGSGLANPSDASFSLSTSVASGTETANALTGSRQICDNAGNCGRAGPIGGNMVDKRAPTISITSPTSTTYALNQVVAAAYSCSDGGSGVASCAGPVANGSNISTAPVGAKTFSVNAADNVGNTASLAINYTVSYNVCVLYDQTRSVKSGAAYPIKIYLCDANGNDVSSSGTVLHATQITGVSSFSGDVEATGSANPDNDFRFDATLGPTGGYIFNLSTVTLGSGTYQLHFTATGDAVDHTVMFGVK